MKINNKMIQLVEKMVSCHDTGDFDTLVNLLVKNVKDSETFITKDLFNEVSDKIHKQFGTFESIEYLGNLNKENSIQQTIWKTRYSETDNEILWQVYLTGDQNNPKITGMLVDVDCI